MPGLYGKQPSLNRLDAGDLLYDVDFRSAYSTILSNWMKAPAAHVLGRDFPETQFRLKFFLTSFLCFFVVPGFPLDEIAW